MCYLDEGGHSQSGAAGLLWKFLVLPEDVVRHRLQQGLHTAQVGREPLWPRQLGGGMGE